MKLSPNRMFTALLLLVLVLTSVALPVSAMPAAIQNVNVTVEPNTAGSQAKYTIEFDISIDLIRDEDWIEVNFPDDLNNAGACTADGQVTVEGTPVSCAHVVTAGGAGENRWRIYIDDDDFTSDIDWHTDNPVTVVFKKDFGLINPPTARSQTLCVKTTDEGEGCDTYDISSQPVRLYLKRQVPHHLCGYKQLDIVASYPTIKDALDAARSIWNQTATDVPEKGQPRWNLFEGCPDLYCQDVPTDAMGIYVGAVIAVGPGTYTDALMIDLPGLMIGSTDGPATTIIDVKGKAPLGSGIKAGVLVSAGGVSIGRATIYEGADDFGDPTDPFELYGLTIQNAGKNVSGTGYGVGVEPAASPYPVFESTPVLFGTNDAAQFTGTAGEALETTLTLSEGQKLVNVSTGVSGYINPIAPGMVVVVKTFDGAELFSPTSEFIKTGDYYAVFNPTDDPVFFCEDARVDIRGNTIQENEAGGIGVYDASVWVDGNLVQDNDDDGFWGEALRCDGVLVCDGDEREKELLQISNNQFLNNGTGSAADWQGPSGCFDEDVDPHNYNQAGIHIVSTAGSYAGALHINNNVMRGNAHAGLALAHEAAGNQPLRIYWNDLEGNPFGLMTAAGFSTDEVDFRYNNIVGNSLWGVKNFGGADFTAKESFWGSWAGPSDGPRPCAHQEGEQSEALGDGDGVSSYVHYNPWLTVDAHDLKLGRPYQHVRAYGSDTLGLEMGWNTLSLPLPPDGRANSLEEIFNLGPGTFLQDEDGNPKFEKAYEYSGVWDSLTTGGDDDDLKVLHGYYIKMVEETRFPVIYGTTWIELPEYELAKGWNLIGSGFGIDRDDFYGQGRWGVARPDYDNEAEKYESEALVSIAPDTVGGGVAMVVSPYVAGQIESWVSTWPAGAGAPSANNLMYTGEGYWVFMKEAGTLAGFESAPLSFQGDPPLPMR